MSEVKGSGQEELPHIQAAAAAPDAGGLRGATPCSRSGGVTVRTCPSAKLNEQCLHFAGAAVKRYPMSKVRETQVRW